MFIEIENLRIDTKTGTFDTPDVLERSITCLHTYFLNRDKSHVLNLAGLRIKGIWGNAATKEASFYGYELQMKGVTKKQISFNRLKQFKSRGTVTFIGSGCIFDNKYVFQFGDTTKLHAVIKLGEFYYILVKNTYNDQATRGVLLLQLDSSLNITGVWHNSMVFPTGEAKQLPELDKKIFARLKLTGMKLV